MAVISKEDLWKRIMDLLTDRKKEVLQAYLDSGRNAAEAARRTNMHVVNVRKYIREDRLIKLALDVYNMGEDVVKPIEIPTFEWMLSELMKNHELDSRELQKLAEGDNEASMKSEFESTSEFSARMQKSKDNYVNNIRKFLQQDN